MPKRSSSASRGSRQARGRSHEHQHEQERRAAAPDTEAQPRPRLRPAWSGTLSFGLVSIPVELYTALRPPRHRTQLLDAQGVHLSRRYYCPADHQELDDSQIVRGYELDNGEYVIVDDEELAALAPKKSREIDLRAFCPRSQLDVMAFERPYVIAPASEVNKAYRLLARVMHERDRAGVATFVMREREYIIAIVSDGKFMFGETLRFADELRPIEELGLLPAKHADPQALAQFDRVLRELAHEKFSPDALVDPAQRALDRLIEEKQRQGEVVHAEVATAEAPPADAEVVDLMQLLKRSLETRNEPRPRQPHAARKAGRRAS